MKRKGGLMFLLVVVQFLLLVVTEGVRGKTVQEIDTDDSEGATSFSLLLLTITLILCFLVAFGIRESGWIYFHETGSTLLIGLIIGLAIHYVSDLERLKDMSQFDAELFFLFLLPPIIFESGFNMKRRHFFRNISSIMLFALVGTTVSTFIFGGLVYGYGLLVQSSASLSLLESLVFGALISATDPVTVLAIFAQLGVDVNLNANIFGESVLNDAVSIVLYRTIIAFQDTPFTGTALLIAIGQFFLVFCGSMVIGVVVALCSAIVFKYGTGLSRHPSLQLALLSLYGYASYLLTDALGYSGIVSVLFCGITMSHYTRNNLSEDAREGALHFFHIIAFVCESAVFLFLGLAMFSFSLQWDVKLIIVAMLACLIGRAAHVFPISALVNLVRKGKNPIPTNHQIFVWYSGLRGAMAFALALSARETLHNHGDVILSTTLAIALFTVILLGGFSLKTLQVLKIETGATAAPSGPNDKEPHSWFLNFDRKYLKPLFTHREAEPQIDVI